MTNAPQLGPTAAALLLLGHGRDPAAWSVLVERHGGSIRCLAHRLITDHALADDAVQDAFLALRDGARRFTPAPLEPEVHAVGWVMRVAWTTILLTARQRRRRSVREVPLTEKDVPRDEPTAISPELVELITAELGRLPERHRLPLTLHYLVGLGYPELAASLRVTLSDARVRVHRALAALRSRLTPRQSQLSIVLLAAHLEALPRPALAPGNAARLQQLLTSSRHAPHGGQLLVSGVAIAASLSGLILLGMALQRTVPTTAPAHALIAPPPPPAPPPAPVVDYDDLEIHLELSDCSIADFCVFCTRILRVPIRFEPSPAAADPPPITLSADHIRLKYILDLVCKVTNLNYHLDPAGGYILSDLPNPPPPPPTAPPAPFDPPLDPHARFLLTVRGVTGSAFMQAYDQAAGGSLRRSFDDRLAGVVSFRGLINEPYRKDRLLQALLNGDGSSSTYAQRLRSPILVPAFEGSLAEACALLSRIGGVTVRLDDQSGPMPRIILVAQRIRFGQMLGDLAAQAHVVMTQSSDGCVLYRPQSHAYADQDGLNSSASGMPYQDHHPRWWWYQSLASGPALVILPRFSQQFFIPHWIDCPLGAVATDLEQRLDVPVTLRVDAATAAEPILLATDERPLGDVLDCLSAASGCECRIALDDRSITITATSDPAAGNPTPPPATAAPPTSTVPRPPLPDVEAPAPTVHTSGG